MADSVNDRGRNRGLLPFQRRAAGLKLFLCAMALGVLLASYASAQVLEGTILLPDSLGPLTGKTHVVFDEDSVHPRIFIGGEGGDVIVADAVTCERVARIRSGPMRALCFVPVHNKLYVSTTDEYGVVVVDCSSYQVTKRLPFPGIVTGLCYNPLVDRVYCAADQSMKIIDCASDSVVDSLMVNGMDAYCALDYLHNKLYVGAKDALKVIDCNRDSVVASIDRIRQSRAICCPPAAGKVYVAVDESLFVLNTGADTVVRRFGFSDALNARLACDPEHGRMYYTFGDGYWGRAYALDYNQDEIIWGRSLWTWPSSLAPVPAQSKVYIMMSGTKYVLDGASGGILRDFGWDTEDSIYYCPAAHRVFVIRQEHAVTALEEQADTVSGLIPLGVSVGGLTADTVDNKLYFFSRSTRHVTRIGVVDCSAKKVQSYSRAFGRILGLAHNSRDDKLYCSADSSIYVLDCGSDTVVKVIHAGGPVQTLDWYPALNKLYAVVIVDTATKVAVVVDCSRDSIVKIIGLNPAGYWDSRLTLLAAEFDQLWVFSPSQRYAVIDCRGDSIIEDTMIQKANYWSASYSPADHRIYAAHNRGLSVIDADSRLPVGSFPFSQEAWSPQVYCATEARKVYWIIMPGVYPFVDSVAVVDTRTDSITNAFAVPFLSLAMCGDHTGDYVWFAGDYRTTGGGFVFTVDTRTDSVVSHVDIPVATQFLVRNSRTKRLYVAGLTDSVIQVVYDSVIFAGLQAAPAGPTQVARLQTLLNRSAPLRSPTEAVLFDASGRRAAVLQSGPNDISHLAPGVYFVRPEPSAVGRQPSAVTKVVIAR